MKNDDSITSNNIIPFASFAILRNAHRDLLKLYQDKEITSAIAYDIKEFIRRGQATGALLEDEENRWDAQSRVDYWVVKLQRAGQELTSAILAEFNPTVELDYVIQCIVAGESTAEDLQLLRNVMTHNVEQGLVQLGKYNVNIGEGKDLQIGDRIYQGADAEAIRQTVLELLESRQFHNLLTHAEFSDRMEQSALPSYQVPLVGRDGNLQEVQQYLNSDNRVIVLHGSAGLGKTRLLLALTEAVGNERILYYVRNEAESIESELASLDPDRQHILVVDDAHRFSGLKQLREVIVNPQLAGKVTLILATRSIFKDSLISQIGLLGNRFETIEVKPLEKQNIEKILQNSPYNLTDQDIRYAIVRIAEGNPLIAGIATGLHKGGINFINLTGDQVLTCFLKEIIQDLIKADINKNDAQIYILYLQILAALGSVNLDEQELQEKIHKIVGISPINEGRFVFRLVESGLVERYGNTLKIASQVLADHIIVQDFFKLTTKQSDYQKQIIEPFFNFKPREIMKNLAEAELKLAETELKDDSPDAGLLLNRKLDELRQQIKHQGNMFRLDLLDWIQDLAYFKPDKILLIVDSIVKGPELPSESIQDQFWGSYEIGHEIVLSKTVEVLDCTIYGKGLEDSLKYLYELATYQTDNKKYNPVREKAKKSLVEIAEFKPRKPYGVQGLLLTLVSGWLKQDFLRNFPLCLELIQPMLNINLSSAEIHPIQPHTIIVYSGSIEITKSVREIRTKALEILYTAYQKIPNLQTRLRIIQAISRATYYFQNEQPISHETQEQLQTDCAKIALFFSKTVIQNAEFPILDCVMEWLWQAKNFRKYPIRELNYLQKQLQNHRGYQLFCLLVGSYRWNDEDESLDWQTAEQKKQQKISEYVEALCYSTLKQAIQELEEIAQQACSGGKKDTSGLNKLLVIFGQTHLNLTQQFIAQTINKNLALKQHIGFVLAGVHLSDSDLARKYVRSWVVQDDSVLWMAIAQSYRFIDWSQPQLEEEWDILCQLVAKQSSEVNLRLFWPIKQLAPYKPTLAVELLKTLAACGEEPILYQVAETISWPSGNDYKWAVPFNNPQDLWEIVQNFERLPKLTYDVEQCLKRIANIHPMQVIDFIEHRIKVKYRKEQTNVYFEAFPLYLSLIFESIQTKTEYFKILCRIRNWMLEENFFLQWEAPALLKSLVYRLENKLYFVLKAWVNSGDVNKLNAVAQILHKFNSGQKFYDLSREIIVRNLDENVCLCIRRAIITTPDEIIAGEISEFIRGRIKEVSPWLNDKNFRVRAFASEQISLLEKDLEREEAQEKLKERNW
jgi:hypothetical protein